MRLEEQITPKLSKKDLCFVEKTYGWLKTNGKLENDDKLLLRNGIESLRQNLFFSASSVLLVLLEKYLRTSLVIYQLKKDVPNIVDLIKKIEEIEQKIEDGGQKYWFNGLCDELLKNGLLKEDIIEELKKIYQDLRHPIQHGIYGRLIRDLSGGQQVDMYAGTLPDNPKKEDVDVMIGHGFSGISNTQGGLYNPMLRIFVLPGVMAQASLGLLDLFQRVVYQIANQNKKE